MSFVADVLLTAWASVRPRMAEPSVGVDGAEAGPGEGGEDERMAGDVLWDALAADEAGQDEGPGVGSEGGGAGRASGGSAGLARLEQHAVGLAGALVGEGELPGIGISAMGCSFEPDGAGASAGVGEHLVEAVPSGSGHSLEGLGQDVGGDRSGVHAGDRRLPALTKLLTKALTTKIVSRFSCAPVEREIPGQGLVGPAPCRSDGRGTPRYARGSHLGYIECDAVVLVQLPRQHLAAPIPIRIDIRWKLPATEGCLLF